MTVTVPSLERLADRAFDVLVVGGGINGAVASAALVAHGASVACVDRGDFAEGTSQESSNLVWGGFKYLENYEFGLVVDLCRSRNRLVRGFPTRLREARFLAALGATAPRSSPLVAAGANLYWGLGRFATARPRHHTTKALLRAEPAIARPGVRGGVEYSDYLIVDNDARFVSEFLFDAEARGAEIANYVSVTGAEPASGGWQVDLCDERTGESCRTACSVLVNAAGPAAAGLADRIGVATSNRTVFSKGVHLIVPRISDSGRVLAFFDDDGRLFYVIPVGHRSMIGTTDTAVADDKVSVTAEDRRFLLDQVNARMTLPSPLTEGDILAERCGVRALVLGEGESAEGRDWTDLSRRHAVELDTTRRAVTVLGGKLTDCLNVGQEVVDAVRELGLDMTELDERWFGEPSAADAAAFARAATGLGLDRPARFEPATTMAELLWRRHGRRAPLVLDLIRGDPALGQPLTDLADLCEAEVLVARDHERVVTLEDYLRRRTMLAQLDRPETLAADAGIRRAASLLLGEAGPAELDSWAAHSGPGAAS